MSTRANIIITDGEDTLYFYRHSDGYPEGALPTLKKFMEAVVSGTIRKNVMQSSGWLILLGAEEYGVKADFTRSNYLDENIREKDWKVGAIEPTTSIHGDIEYLYTLNLKDKTIKIQAYNYIKGVKGSPVIDTLKF